MFQLHLYFHKKMMHFVSTDPTRGKVIRPARTTKEAWNEA